jgi:Leucine-rich repeat (LRR) protein
MLKNIRNNKFTSIINDSNNYELKEFIASNNEFSTGIFYSFNIPSIIKKLILDNNNIDAIPFEISFFKLLVTLNLAHNNIKEMDNGIFELENLKYFDISNNPELNVTLINFSGSKPIGICELTNTNVLCYQRNTCNNENVNNTLRECTMDEINAIKNNIDKNDEPAGVNMIFYGALYLLIQLLPSIVYLFFLGCCSKRSNGSSKNSKENESPTPPKNVSEQSTPHFNGNEVGDPSLPVN